MPKLTITEALAELKTLAKRIEKKREFIRQYAARQEMIKDPLAKEGGASKAIEAAFQAVADLEGNVVAIRTAIARSNLNQDLTVEDTTMTVAAWLAWRRDVAPQRQAFLTSALRGIDTMRREAVQKGYSLVKEGQDAKPSDVVVHVNEASLQADVELMEKILGTLDGKLSLVNATTTIEY